MKQIFKILKKHFSIILVSSCFFIIAVINTHSHIGLILDNSRQFFASLVFNDILYGSENIGNYQYIVRYFSTMLPQFSVIFSIFIGIVDIKYLLSIFTFWVYFSPIIFLSIIYINIPKDKKETFEIILLSFLVCTVYMKYVMLAESLFSSLFLWIIFIIYFYINYDKLKLFNLITLMIFSIFLISSHPNVVVFIPMLLFFGINKYFKTKNISPPNKIVLISSFIILIIALIFNIYCILFPFSLFNDYWKFSMLRDLNFIYFISAIFSIIIISILKTKYDKYLKIISIIFFTIVFYTVLQITPIQGVFYRMLNLYLVFLCMLFLIFISVFKIKLKYTYIKIANIVLMASFLISTLIYANKNNRFNYEILEYMENNEKISIQRFARDGLTNKYDIQAAILFKKIFLNSNNNCKILLSSEEFFGKKYSKMYIEQNRFKKFGIDIYKIMEIPGYYKIDTTD